MMQWLLQFWASCPAPTRLPAGSQQESEHDYWRTQGNQNHEYRVGMTPAGVQELTARGHKVLVQQQGGEAIGLSDAEYQAAGAELVASAAEIFARAEMIVKVKEPQPEGCELLRPGQLLFTYLHLAPDPVQTQLLVHSGQWPSPTRR